MATPEAWGWEPAPDWAKEAKQADEMREPDCQYDYKNQAWVVDGRYQPCGHYDACQCYGKLHAGEQADICHDCDHLNCTCV